jgi:hypothetical protein
MSRSPEETGRVTRGSDPDGQKRSAATPFLRRQKASADPEGRDTGSGGGTRTAGSGAQSFPPHPLLGAAERILGFCAEGRTEKAVEAAGPVPAALPHRGYMGALNGSWCGAGMKHMGGLQRLAIRFGYGAPQCIERLLGTLGKLGVFGSPWLTSAGPTATTDVADARSISLVRIFPQGGG